LNFIKKKKKKKKKNSIEYFNTIFKLLFLCFQEIGNGTNDTRNSCKVTFPQLTNISRKERIKNTPGSRDLYLEYHVSYQTVLKDNFCSHHVFLTTYSLWNHSKCSVGNVFIPI